MWAGLMPETVLGWFRAPDADGHLAWAVAAVMVWPLFLLLSALLRRLLRRPPGQRLLLAGEIVAIPLCIVGLRALLVGMLGLGAEDGLYARLAAIEGVALWLAGAWLLNRALDVLLWRRLAALPGDQAVPRLAVHVVAGIVYIVAILGVVALVLDQPLTGLLVSSSVLAGIVGLALQGTLTDLLAGIAIGVERPYVIGDWLEVEGGFIGRVEDITWRSTRLVSWNDSIYVVPNSRAARAVIHNLSEPTRRYGHWFGVWLPPEVPSPLARRLLLEACLSSPAVLPEPAPTVRLRDIGHPPFEYRVFVYFRSYEDHFELLNDLLLRIRTQLGRVGIEPMGPRQDVILRRPPEAAPAEPDATNLLRRVDLFRCLNADERGKLAAGAQVETRHAGETIVVEGEPGSSLFIVASGVVRVTRALGGGGSVEVGRLSVYEHFGEMSLLTGEPRGASVLALTDCTLLRIGKDALDEVLRGRPRIAAELAADMERRRDRNSALLEARRQDGTAGGPTELVDRILIFFGLGQSHGETGESERP